MGKFYIVCDHCGNSKTCNCKRGKRGKDGADGQRGPPGTPAATDQTLNKNSNVVFNSLTLTGNPTNGLLVSSVPTVNPALTIKNGAIQSDATFVVTDSTSSMLLAVESTDGDTTTIQGRTKLNLDTLDGNVISFELDTTTTTIVPTITFPIAQAGTDIVNFRDNNNHLLMTLTSTGTPADDYYGALHVNTIISNTQVVVQDITSTGKVITINDEAGVSLDGGGIFMEDNTLPNKNIVYYTNPTSASANVNAIDTIWIQGGNFGTFPGQKAFFDTIESASSHTIPVDIPLIKTTSISSDTSINITAETKQLFVGNSSGIVMSNFDISLGINCNEFVATLWNGSSGYTFIDASTHTTSLITFGAGNIPTNVIGNTITLQATSTTGHALTLANDVITMDDTTLNIGNAYAENITIGNSNTTTSLNGEVVYIANTNATNTNIYGQSIDIGMSNGTISLVGNVAPINLKDIVVSSNATVISWNGNTLTSTNANFDSIVNGRFLVACDGTNVYAGSITYTASTVLTMSTSGSLTDIQTFIIYFTMYTLSNITANGYTITNNDVLDSMVNGTIVFNNEAYNIISFSSSPKTITLNRPINITNQSIDVYFNVAPSGYKANNMATFTNINGRLQIVPITPNSFAPDYQGYTIETTLIPSSYPIMAVDPATANMPLSYSIEPIIYMGIINSYEYPMVSYSIYRSQIVSNNLYINNITTPGMNIQTVDTQIVMTNVNNGNFIYTTLDADNVESVTITKSSVKALNFDSINTSSGVGIGMNSSSVSIGSSGDSSVDINTHSLIIDITDTNTNSGEFIIKTNARECINILANDTTDSIAIGNTGTSEINLITSVVKLNNTVGSTGQYFGVNSSGAPEWIDIPTSMDTIYVNEIFPVAPGTTLSLGDNTTTAITLTTSGTNNNINLASTKLLLNGTAGLGGQIIASSGIGTASWSDPVFATMKVGTMTPVTSNITMGDDTSTLAINIKSTQSISLSGYSGIIRIQDINENNLLIDGENIIIGEALNSTILIGDTSTTDSIILKSQTEGIISMATDTTTIDNTSLSIGETSARSINIGSNSNPIISLKSLGCVITTNGSSSMNIEGKNISIGSSTSITSESVVVGNSQIATSINGSTIELNGTTRVLGNIELAPTGTTTIDIGNSLTTTTLSGNIVFEPKTILNQTVSTITWVNTSVSGTNTTFGSVSNQYLVAYDGTHGYASQIISRTSNTAITTNTISTTLTDVSAYLVYTSTQSGTVTIPSNPRSYVVPLASGDNLVGGMFIVGTYIYNIVYQNSSSITLNRIPLTTGSVSYDIYYNLSADYTPNLIASLSYSNSDGNISNFVATVLTGTFSSSYSNHTFNVSNLSGGPYGFPIINTIDETVTTPPRYTIGPYFYPDGTTQNEIPLAVYSITLEQVDATNSNVLFNASSISLPSLSIINNASADSPGEGTVSLVNLNQAGISICNLNQPGLITIMNGNGINTTYITNNTVNIANTSTHPGVNIGNNADPVVINGITLDIAPSNTTTITGTVVTISPSTSINMVIPTITEPNSFTLNGFPANPGYMFSYGISTIVGNLGPMQYQWIPPYIIRPTIAVSTPIGTSTSQTELITVSPGTITLTITLSTVGIPKIYIFKKIGTGAGGVFIVTPSGVSINDDGINNIQLVDSLQLIWYNATKWYTI